MNLQEKANDHIEQMKIEFQEDFRRTEFFKEIRLKYPKATKSVDIADVLSDMILFHRKVRKNGENSWKEW